MVSDESPKPSLFGSTEKKEEMTKDQKAKPTHGIVDHIRRLGDRERKRKNRVASYLASGTRCDAAPDLATLAKRPQSERPTLTSSDDFQSFHMIADPDQDPHRSREIFSEMKESHSLKRRAGESGREETRGEERDEEQPLIGTSVKAKQRYCECECSIS